MTEKSRALGDWIWTVVGILGVACIAIALYLLIFGAGGRGDTGSADRARELHESGLEKLSAGEFQGALRDLARAESIADKHAEEFDASWREGLQRDIRTAVLSLAQELWTSGVEKLKAGNAASASEDLERAVGLTRKRNPLYLNDYGEALAGLGEGDRARNAWLSAMTLGPFLPRPYHNLALWNEKAGNLQRALSLNRAALALYAEASVPEGLADKVAKLSTDLEPTFEKEIEGFRAHYRANPADWAAFNYLLFRQLHSTRVAEDAAPEEGLRVALLGAGRGIGDLAALLERQESAVEDRKESVVDRAGLGTILLFLGDFPRARKVFREALALSDTDPLSLLGSVLSGLLSGEHDTELDRKVAERFAGNQIAWISRAASLIAEGLADPADGKDKLGMADVALKMALRVDAGMPEVYRLLGRVYSGEEHEEERERILQAYRRIP